MTRPRPHRAAALTLALLLATTSCSSGDADEQAAPAPATSSARPAAVEIECANIERAYKAWKTDIFVPTTADQWADANEGQIMMAIDRGKTFLADVSGYDGQPAKELASAVAEYNVEVTFVNLQLGLGGIEGENATKTASALQRVEIAFRSWQTKTCS
ncbi:hypothetical protein [Verrucosispora sp. NA02020]|uniref:hypothetical protein n=1 Tax=Verrucosispora sp. NA02020 TaxID=2742132 RepID=UPI00158FADD3|nr:hypothetical protein [Verrucosispora sp. NA02020]QKW15398.1 hypothetical protein HUT12_23275 [Verrucosispora sp. NA02020]